jgi:hypothetical protein
MKYIVKIGYRVNYEAEVEVESDTQLKAIDIAFAEKDKIVNYRQVFATKPAVISVSDKA